jgi:hypothetical protein
MGDAVIDSAPSEARTRIAELIERMGDAIIGQQQVIERLVVGLLANGNLLVEGLPGLAKSRAIKALAKNNYTQPFKAVLDDDLEALKAGGIEGVVQLIMASHAGMTTEVFATIVGDWIAKARHPRFERPFTELVSQPMLELLADLRDNGFKTWIVSGGGIEFMRPWTEKVYGVPPEQVIGSNIKIEFALREGVPVLVRKPEIDFVDDESGKPVGIHKNIGRRSLAAFGNSDGDLQMLQWTTGPDGRRLGVIVHHDDAGWECAYDRDSHVGRLDQALDAAEAEGWLLVSMKDDWIRIFPGARQ